MSFETNLKKINSFSMSSTKAQKPLIITKLNLIMQCGQTLRKAVEWSHRLVSRRMVNFWVNYSIWYTITLSYHTLLSLTNSSQIHEEYLKSIEMKVNESTVCVFLKSTGILMCIYIVHWIHSSFPSHLFVASNPPWVQTWPFQFHWNG